jgi:glycosyltransferase involved in cell wall biosynthesis
LKQGRILYLITRAMHAGAQTQLLDIMKHSQDRFDVSLGIGEEGFMSEATRQIGAPVHLLPHLVRPFHPVKDIRAYEETKALIEKVRPDLIHPYAYKTRVIGGLAAQRLGVLSVFTDQGWPFTGESPWHWKMTTIPSERWAASKCAKLITVSEFDRQLALQNQIAPPEKIVTIHNTVPDHPLRANPGAEGEVRIIMVARFEAQKDHSLLVRALSGVDENFRILFVGTGVLQPQVEAEAKALGMSDKVDFLGSREDVPDLLASSHLFALISNWEGFPLTTAEAMRAGLPVVVSDVGGAKEALLDGENGFVVPQGDLETVRDRLVRLIRDPALRARMSVASRKYFETELSFQLMVDRTHAVYDEVLARRKRAA